MACLNRTNFLPEIAYLTRQWGLVAGQQNYVMETKADEYRKALAECEKLAKAATDPVLKSSYEDMAVKWRDLVERAEKNGW